MSDGHAKLLTLDLRLLEPAIGARSRDQVLIAPFEHEKNMAYRTVESILHPDSHLTLPPSELPRHPVRVMVTILEDDDEDSLADLGDYSESLADYEKLLAQGSIQW